MATLFHMIKMRVQAVEVLQILRHSRATFIIILKNLLASAADHTTNKRVITYFNVLRVYFRMIACCITIQDDALFSLESDIGHIITTIIIKKLSAKAHSVYVALDSNLYNTCIELLSKKSLMCEML